MLWRASKSDDVLWASFEDDEHIVFHRPSSKTHFLNAASATLLRHVLSVPVSGQQAAQLLAEAQRVALDEKFVAAVDESLHHLEYLGLVERV